MHPNDDEILILLSTPFLSLVHKVAQEVNADLRFTQGAVNVIQEASEAFLIAQFERKHFLNNIWVRANT